MKNEFDKGHFFVDQDIDLNNMKYEMLCDNAFRVIIAIAQRDELIRTRGATSKAGPRLIPDFLLYVYEYQTYI